MSISDVIADALTALRNAYRVRKESVEIKYSKLLENVCEILKREGYIDNYKKVEDNKQGVIKVYLKYERGKPALSSIRRVSSPGRRRYVDRNHLYRIRQGYGMRILTTSKGIITDKDARSMGIGGEIICEVF